MGNTAIDKCIFTGYRAFPIIDQFDCIDYLVEVNGRKFKIRLTHESLYWCENSDFYIENKHKFHSLLHNNQWIENQDTLITLEILKELLNNRKTVFSPSELLENIFIIFFNSQDEIGQKYLMNKKLFEYAFTLPFYFKSNSEALFFIKELENSEILNLYSRTGIGLSEFDFAWQITFKGLTHYNQLISEGQLSKKCFIAMSFKDETKLIREKIKEALVETGYEPIIIDEQHTSSDQTINDAIIAALRKCKFCIADFSYHSNGVYFESGFALGQGKQVIYTCSKEEFANAHFDIRPLQHIIYENPEELKRALVNKIEAWIH